MYVSKDILYCLNMVFWTTKRPQTLKNKNKGLPITIGASWIVHICLWSYHESGRDTRGIVAPSITHVSWRLWRRNANQCAGKRGGEKSPSHSPAYPNGL